jgi:type III pantothenate kinase
LNLAIDIGNSLTKLGVFDEDKLIEKQTMEELSADALRKLVISKQISNIVMAVSGKAKFRLRDIKVSGLQIELSANTPLPIVNSYKTPESLGKDRLAAMVGAYHLFPGESSLVIDAGTCITIDMITYSGSYLGGNISPGIDLRLKGMYAFTAALPLVERMDHENVLGSTTAEAMQNGAMLGVLYELEGYIEVLTKEFGSINIILTGGDAEYFAGQLKRQIFVEPEIILIGLNKILSFNAGNKN